MNLWPRNTLRHWIYEALNGRTVQAIVSAEARQTTRNVEVMTLKGYELYRVFKLRSGNEQTEITAPSVVDGGFADDPAPVRQQNLTMANRLLDRDLTLLAKYGIRVSTISRFTGEMLEIKGEIY